MRSQPVRPLHAVVVMAVLLAGLWVLEGLDQLSGNALDTYGIHARDVDGLPDRQHQDQAGAGQAAVHRRRVRDCVVRRQRGDVRLERGGH